MSQVFTEKTKEKYIKKKLRDLREFGYPNLTEDEVRQQLEKVLNDEPINVIGMFIKSDVVKR
jgi:hypothetical protein